MAKNKSAKCAICGVIDESLFYKGQKSLCKEHYKEKVRANREANAEYYKEYDRNRANIPERIALRKAYQKTIAFKDSHSVAVKKYNAANTARKEARSAVGHAIRDGKIDRLPCCICGSEKSEAHHVAYNLPLDVVWLCDKHHKEVHKMHRSILRNTNQPPTCSAVFFSKEPHEGTDSFVSGHRCFGDRLELLQPGKPVSSDQGG